MTAFLACSSFSSLRKQAEAGDAEAQNKLGTMYSDGEGAPQNYLEASKWYRKAAEQGNASAQVNLGWLYISGQGVPQDYEEAYNWFLKAAEQGNGDGMSSIGNLYKDRGYKGSPGRQIDYVQVYIWYSLAAARTSPEKTTKNYMIEKGGKRRYVGTSYVRDAYISDRDDAASHLSPYQLREAQRMASEWEKSHPIK